MKRYAITQSGQPIGGGTICYMAGLQNTPEHEGEYLGAEDTLTLAFALIAVHTERSEPFTVEYIPWKD